MIVEAALWTGTALAAPELLRFVWGRWGGPVGGRLQALLSFGRWFRSLGIPYLALITGAVAPGDVGLSGHSGAEWLRGVVGCAAVLGVAWAAARRRRVALPYPMPVSAALDEPRWALYRGTGGLLADPRWVGPLIGLGLGVMEWTLWQRPWVQGARPQAEAWARLARVCGSSALFLLTRNLWLIVLTQVGLSFILTGPRRPSDDQA